MSKNYILSEKQIQSMIPFIQNRIDSILDDIKTESEDWGMGEMSEYHTVNSVNGIEVIDVYPQSYGIVVNLYFILDLDKTKTSESDYQDLRAEIQSRLKNWIPKIKLFISDIHSM